MRLFVPASTLRAWRAARATATSVGESESRWLVGPIAHDAFK